jgi:hypothetical protein
VNGHEDIESVNPAHRLARATTSRAARQCTAWLSPTSATVARARDAGTPKAQTSGTSPGIGRHGLLGTSGAALGLGTTRRRSFGFSHG